jgi:hypothetical protein
MPLAETGRASAREPDISKQDQVSSEAARTLNFASVGEHRRNLERPQLRCLIDVAFVLRACPSPSAVRKAPRNANA